MKEQQQSLDELANSQFRNLTYRRWMRDFTLDENLPTYSGDHVSSSPKVSLGALDTFPIEVLQYILAQLDVRTLTNFHYVNHQARALVASLPHYKAINTHARNVLRSILSISMGPWITLGALHQALCTAECVTCGAFGGYLYLLTCTRVCYPCFVQHDSYLLLRRLQAKRRFALTRPLLKTLPLMRSRPGTYSPHNRKRRWPLDLVDGKSAQQAGIALHGSFAAMEERVREAAEQKLRQWAAKESINSSARRPPSTEEPWDAQEGNPLRFMAVVRAPWLNQSSQSVEWGAYCDSVIADIYPLALQTINSNLLAGTSKIVPEECLVFEDSVPGVEAGRRAGMRVVWVPHPGLAAELQGREREVLAGRTGLVKIGDEEQLGEVDDGFGECSPSLEDFPYGRFGIEVPI